MLEFVQRADWTSALRYFTLVVFSLHLHHAKIPTNRGHASLSCQDRCCFRSRKYLGVDADEGVVQDSANPKTLARVSGSSA